MKAANLSNNIEQLNSTKSLKMLNFRSSDNISKDLVFLRHGESMTNLNLSHYGHFRDHEVPLSDKGKKQAEYCGSYWSSYCNENEITSVMFLYSHYARAKDTAHIMASVLQDSVPEVQCYQDLHIHEQLWPECVGMPVTKVDSYLQDCLKSRHKKGIYHYKFSKGGENGFEVSKRANRFIEKLQTIYLSDSSNLIITITHSYFMRVLLKEFFGWSIETFHQIRKPENCRGYALSLSNETLTMDLNQLAFKEVNEMD